MRCLIALLVLVTLTPAPSSSATDMEAGVKELAQQISRNMGDAKIERIAIVEFGELNGGISALGQFLAEELTTQLFIVSPGRFQVVERRQLMQVLEEQQLSVTGLLDDAALDSIGRILGVQALVTGSITDLGNEVKVNARLIAIDTARIFAVASTRFPKVGTVADLISRKAEEPSDPSSPPSSSSGPGRPVETREQNKSTFSSRVFELEVVSVEPTPEEITLVAEIQPRTDEPIDFLLNTYNTFVLDADGNRWGGLTKTHDTLGVVHVNHTQSVELLPGTTVRSRFRFEADVLASERPPNPQPPFTFIAEEMISKQRIVIEDLR